MFAKKTVNVAMVAQRRPTFHPVTFFFTYCDVSKECPWKRPYVRRATVGFSGCSANAFINRLRRKIFHSDGFGLQALAKSFVKLNRSY